jgi:hypothetical protein
MKKGDNMGRVSEVKVSMGCSRPHKALHLWLEGNL